MENAFYAIKVTFVNEFYDIARVHGVDFNQLRELWLADTRISRDHTFVYPDARGFSGKCLPKDCNAIVHSSRQQGYEPKFMAACLKINEEFVALNKRRVAATWPGHLCLVLMGCSAWTDNALVRTIMLPGLGADARFLTRNGPRCRAWRSRLGCPTVRASRWPSTAAAWPRPSIPHSRSTWAACRSAAWSRQEMARYVQPRAVLLIASCRRGRRSPRT